MIVLLVLLESLSVCCLLAVCLLFGMICCGSRGHLSLDPLTLSLGQLSHVDTVCIT